MKTLGGETATGVDAGRMRRGTVPGLDGLRGVAVLVVVVEHRETILIPGRVKISAGPAPARPASSLLAAHTLYAWSTGLSLRVEWMTVRGALAYVSNWTWKWDGPQSAPGLGHLWSLSVEQQFYLGGFTLVAVCTAAVILAAIDGRWAGTRVLELRPSATSGGCRTACTCGICPCSTSLTGAGADWGAPARVVVGLSVTAAVTLASWKLLEQPILRFKNRSPRARVREQGMAAVAEGPPP